MFQLRNRPRNAQFAFFGLGLCGFALTPTEVGYQDIASRLARQPGVAERWHSRMFSGVNSIHVAAYSFSLPIGTAVPQAAAYRLASLDHRDLGVTGSIPRNPAIQTPPRYQTADFPKVDRTLKGDRLVVAPREPAAPDDVAPANVAPSKEEPATPNSSARGAKTARAAPPVGPELAAAMNSPPLPQYDAAPALEAHPLHGLKAPPDTETALFGQNSSQDGFSVQTASLFFGSNALGGPLETMERWQPGEEPVVVAPRTSTDPDMKAMASLHATGEEASKGVESGESVAPKGEVNSEDQRVKTPAERLGLLDEKSRARSEKCLAEAVYFEARGEAVRGQIAVAQVVLNRAF